MKIFGTANIKFGCKWGNDMLNCFRGCYAYSRKPIKKGKVSFFLDHLGLVEWQVSWYFPTSFSHISSPCGAIIYSYLTSPKMTHQKLLLKYEETCYVTKPNRSKFIYQKLLIVLLKSLNRNSFILRINFETQSAILIQ